MPDPTPSPTPSPSPSPTPSPTPEPTAWYGDDQKDYVSNKGWKSPADAVTSAINLEKLLGADKAGRTFVMPKDDKDVEGIKAFRAKLGVPESADKYELPVPEGESKEFAQTVAKWMHDAGVPKAAAQAIAGNWNGHIAELVKQSDIAMKAESDKQLTGLKGEWGDKFDENSEHARRFMRASGWDDAKIKRYEEAFGTATMLKDFHGLGSKMGEHQNAAGEGGASFTPSAKAAQTKIAELGTQRTAGKIDQKTYLAEVEKLGPIAYPDRVA